MIVLDASLALAWAHVDEQTPAIMRAFERVVVEGAVVPPIWPIDVANSLTMAVRRNRISAEVRQRIFSSFNDLDLEVEALETARLWSAVVPLADRLLLTVYDAGYLEVAIRRHLALGTTDDDLARAARAEGVEVLP